MIRAFLAVASFPLLLLFLPLALVFAAPALAPGDLDTTFGTGGKLTTDFGGNDQGFSVVMQSDGKMVVAGYSDGDFALARYNANGTLDTTFGTGGKVVSDFGGNDVAYSVAFRPTAGSWRQ